MAASLLRQPAFFPKADAAILSCRLAPPPTYPDVVGPVYDAEHVHIPLLPASTAAESACYPPPIEAYAPATIPDDQQAHTLGRYLRATLARNERLRLSMLWYYTCDVFKEAEFLSGLQEKVRIAQETTGWEYAIVGILDINYYKRLAAVGVPLGILPRGECLCAHMVAQPPGSVFLLPNMLEDWRFQRSPYVEFGGMQAYAGAPLRLQDEAGNTVCLGSLCVASRTPEESLTRSQQTTMIRMADWIVADLVQLTRARRQRERQRMTDAVLVAQEESDRLVSEEPVLRALRVTYVGAMVDVQSTRAGVVHFDGRDPVAISDLSGGLWEDTDYIDELIAKSNHQEFLPTTRVIRAIVAKCDSVAGQSLLAVGSKDIKLIFDDIDAWFIHTCAGIITQVWQKRLLAEVMVAKEKFVRGFSHQLRTPVHGILGSAELLTEGLKDMHNTITKATATATASLGMDSTVTPDEDYENHLDTIRSAGRDLISIINSMITLNRWTDVAISERNYGTHTTQDLETELFTEIQKLFFDDVRYNASVIFNHNLPSDLCSLRTDIGLLRDSLTPIIVNAIQSMTQGLVMVTITARPDHNELIVDIEDTGHGIPLDDHQRIFELYEQVDVYSTGAGLGLTLATKFAALLRGSVTLVASKIDHGSHFRVVFENMESTCSLPHQTSHLLDLPRCFYTIPSRHDTLSVSHHFAKFLVSQGFSSSDAIDDAFVVIDYIADEKRFRAALSSIPSHQIVICLVPFLDADDQLHDVPRSIVFVRGPFLTRTMCLALERADRLVAQLNRVHVTKAYTGRRLPLLPKPDETTATSGPRHLGSIGTTEATARLLQGSMADQIFLDEADQAHPELESSQQVVHHLVNNSDVHNEKGLSDGLLFQTMHLPTPPEGGPTEFDFNSSSESESPGPVPTSGNTTALSHPTALLVDDNAINLRVMEMYCKKRKLPYMIARDGQDAVDLFRANQQSSADGTQGQESQIRLILMDLQMPVCDGIDATRQIRKLEKEHSWEESVLLMVTGQDSSADREAANDAGAQEYHVKPVSMKTLDRSLQRHFPCFGTNT